MKRRDLLRRLRENGWLISSGKRHDMAKHNDKPGVKIPIPRHREIDEDLAREILQEAGLK